MDAFLRGRLEALGLLENIERELAARGVEAMLEPYRRFSRL
jgi:hypothetical protein